MKINFNRAYRYFLQDIAVFLGVMFNNSAVQHYYFDPPTPKNTKLHCKKLWYLFW